MVQISAFKFSRLEIGQNILKEHQYSLYYNSVTILLVFVNLDFLYCWSVLNQHVFSNQSPFCFCPFGIAVTL